MRAALLGGAFLLVSTVAPPTASAFTIESGFTADCHERITVTAFAQVLVGQAPALGVRPPEGRWDDVLEHLAPGLGLDRDFRFSLFSLLVGVRSPDSEGHAVTNLSSLRGIQGDPRTQYLHCLRARGDDFAEGDVAAMEGCREAIAENIVRAVEAVLSPDESQVLRVPFTLDNYGSFDVEVLAYAYHLGRALHTFQDSFSHTLRSPDLRRVVHVMNYEAAIAGDLDEARDGLPHSSGADSCEALAEGTGAIVNRERLFAAIEGTADVLRAFSRVIRAPRERPDDAERLSAELRAVFLKWMRLADPRHLGSFESCTVTNNYCNSEWLESARVGPAGPTFGCAVSSGGSDGGGSAPPSGTPRWPLGLSFVVAVMVVALRAPGRR